MKAGEELRAALERLLVFEDGIWRYRDEDDDRGFVARLTGEPLALEMAKTEHRCWCCYMASIGWAEGPREEKLRRHPCLTDWDTLTERRSDTCVYDLMSFLMESESNGTGR